MPARRTRQPHAGEADPPATCRRGGPAGTAVARAISIVSRPPRLRKFEYRGFHSYFLTFCTHRRHAAFAAPAIARLALEQILRSAARFKFAVFAYCVMPDHVHLLVHGRSTDADLRRFAKSAKQSCGQSYRRHAQCPLWQEGYYDRIVRPEEDLSGVARYIIENPVRAGLAHAAIDYPFVGSELWTVREILERDVVIPRLYR
jgi:putative transposase